MAVQQERRQSDRDADDALSPELVDLLLACGGEVRETDRELIDGGWHSELFDRRRPERRRTETA